MWMVLGLLVIIAVIVAAVLLGKKSTDASFISFPCRVCGAQQNISVAETVRRVKEAHGKGALADLNKHQIPCMKCGSSQTADWLMQPRVRQMLSEFDAGTFREQTAVEMMNLASADSIASGAVAPAAPSIPDPLAVPPKVKGP